MKRPYLPLFAVAVLSGCGLAPVTDPTSRLFDPPRGSRLVLNQELAIPAGTARVFLQDGRPVALAALRRYYPFCELEVRDVRESGVQTVRPDTFTVTHVERHLELGKRDTRVLLAGVGWGVGIRVGGMDKDSGSGLAMSQIRMRLHSERQPQVRRLDCTAGWADLQRTEYPTLAEMRGALGPIATLEIHVREHAPQMPRGYGY